MIKQALAILGAACSLASLDAAETWPASFAGMTMTSRQEITVPPQHTAEIDAFNLGLTIQLLTWGYVQGSSSTGIAVFDPASKTPHIPIAWNSNWPQFNMGPKHLKRKMIFPTEASFSGVYHNYGLTPKVLVVQGFAMNNGASALVVDDSVKPHMPAGMKKVALGGVLAVGAGGALLKSDSRGSNSPVVAPNQKVYKDEQQYRNAVAAYESQRNGIQTGLRDANLPPEEKERIFQGWLNANPPPARYGETGGLGYYGDGRYLPVTPPPTNYGVPEGGNMENFDEQDMEVAKQFVDLGPEQ